MTTSPDPFHQPEFYEGVPFKRLIAWIIDTGLIAVISVLIAVLTIGIGFFVFAFLLMVVGFAYRVITLTNGSATWGMRIMSMEIRDAQDRPLSLGLAFLHTLGYSLSVTVTIVQVVSIVFMCTSARAQGLTDMFLGTVPMNRRQRT